MKFLKLLDAAVKRGKLDDGTRMYVVGLFSQSEEGAPGPRLCRVCGQKWQSDTNNTLCPVCESPDTTTI